MLHLYQSNRLEDLATLLQQVQAVRPLSHPLMAEEIIVQSQGMRRFLSQHLARNSGIAANLTFNLPAGFNWRLMRKLLPNIPDLSPFSPEVMHWRLLGLFSHHTFHNQPEFTAARAALNNYLASSQHAAYQLAAQLADIFDQYLVYRPQWINAWQTGKLIGLGDDEAWQAELWRFLDDGNQIAPHRVAMWQQLLHTLSTDKLPERLFVFGIATLAPMYLQLLQAIAQHTEVHIFALNPSSEYWGNIIEPNHILHQPDETNLSQSGHPLLASLGKQGRDFFNALIEAETQIELPVYPDKPQSNSLLHRLQYDIQTLQLPQHNAQLDNSIHIVAAHSPLRELQILKDHILQLLHDHPTWQPHDIAVLTPHIEPYSPFIEAIFGQANDTSPRLPYSISDIKLSRRQPLLYALEQTLSLLDSRFEVDKVLPLLDSENILQRFELTREDLPLIRDTIAQLNIHWGLDQAMRGENNTLFTWQQGLERLILGWMLPDGPQLWQNISAWHSDPNHLTVLSRFAALIRTLAHIYHTWQTPADIATWVERIQQLIHTLFQQQDSDQQAIQQIEDQLKRWQAEAHLAHFQLQLPQHTVIRHITRFLSSHSEAGFLQGGITFCSMVPMRSLPFKAICLLGLNDTDFPSNTKAASFDLIARHPQKGDRARRNDDRYLFLESIMSAREHLYLSYIGKSIHNNENLAPSALLSELLDVIADMTQHTTEQLNSQWLVQHPLQAFSSQYFNGQTTLQSSRQDYANALNQPLSQRKPFYQHPLTTTEPNTNHIIQQTQLTNFWQNPLKTWLRQTLNWHAPYQEPIWDAHEPFTLSNNDQAAAAYLDARRHNENFHLTAQRLQAQSLLPTGELGRLWRANYETNAKLLDDQLLKSPPYSAYPYQLPLGNHTLQGSLEHLHQHGQIYFATQNPHAPEEIGLLLKHLIFNAVRPHGMAHYHTHRLQAGNSQTLPEITQSHAIELLSQWLNYYHIGQNQPLPFLPRTSLAAAKALQKNNKRDQAEQEAFNAYYGNKKTTGQCDYPEVAILFAHAEESPIQSPLFWHMIEYMLLPSLQALTNTTK